MAKPVPSGTGWRHQVCHEDPFVHGSAGSTRGVAPDLRCGESVLNDANPIIVMVPTVLCALGSPGDGAAPSAVAAPDDHDGE